MAKNSITDYSKTASLNTDIQSVDIDEGCLPSGINNAIRELMADLAAMNDGTVSLTSPSFSSVNIDAGTIDGTVIGGTTAAAGTFTTVTSDGLTIDSSGTIRLNHATADDFLTITQGGTQAVITADSAAGAANLLFKTTAAGVDTSAMQLFSSNDIAFYEDTGTTPKFYWDASAERLGIGTSSPEGTLHVENVSNNSLIMDAPANRFNSIGFQTAGVDKWWLGRADSDQIAGDAFFIGIDNGNVTDAGGLSNKLVITQSGAVGIGTSSPLNKLDLAEAGDTQLRITSTDGNNVRLGFNSSGTVYNWIEANGTNLLFAVGNAEAMRIDSSGTVLVGKTSADNNANGVILRGSNYATFTTTSTRAIIANRKTSDGDIIEFRKDNVKVGSIGNDGSDRLILNTENTTGYLYVDGAAKFRWRTNDFIPHDDNTKNLGDLATRFDDIYATNGTIQTSDRNEKQQIASLTDAEITAAKAISKLFKTFKWNDKVEAKGDAARRHTGVIAQDVQQAMTDAGLNAGNYAFFISTTWWETQTEVPAVEAVEAQDAVYDEDGNIVTEAIEAVEAADAYTRTDTYDTAEEAPEGATERTRLGIRYPELLAFVGAATEQRLADIETRLTTLEGN